MGATDMTLAEFLLLEDPSQRSFVRLEDLVRHYSVSPYMLDHAGRPRRLRSLDDVCRALFTRHEARDTMIGHHGRSSSSQHRAQPSCWQPCVCEL